MIKAGPGGESGVLVEGSSVRWVRDEEQETRYKFEVSQGGLCLEDTVRSRVRAENDLRVEIERILFPIYFNFFPGFNFTLWLTWLTAKDKINFELLLFTAEIAIVSPGRPSWGSSLPGALLVYPRHMFGRESRYAGIEMLDLGSPLSVQF